MEHGEIKYNQSLEYSLDEKRVGTWVDDKPLYQKTIYAETITDYMKGDFWNCHIPHNINDFDTIFITDVSFSPSENLGSYYSNTYFFSQVLSDHIRLDISYNGNLWPNDISELCNFYITVRYTKKGDTV